MSTSSARVAVEPGVSASSARVVVELDVSASSARVAVDRNEELCVVVGSAARPTCRRQLDRHVDPQSPVLRPTRLHPTSSVTS